VRNVTKQTVPANARRDNLRKLIKQHGGPTVLARKLGYKNAAFLVTMAGPHPTREVTERSARTIEVKLGLPLRSLDAAGSSPALGSANTELMRESVRRVAEHLDAVAVKLAPAKLADLVLFVYADALDNGVPSDELIQRAVQLAK
jgi:hypothetical protein